MIILFVVCYVYPNGNKIRSGCVPEVQYAYDFLIWSSGGPKEIQTKFPNTVRHNSQVILWANITNLTNHRLVLLKQTNFKLWKYENYRDAVLWIWTI